MVRLEDFRHIVPDERLAEIYNRARGLYGKHIVHVNATFLAVTQDDKMPRAQSTLLFVELKKAGMPAEIHLNILLLIENSRSCAARSPHNNGIMVLPARIYYPEDYTKGGHGYGIRPSENPASTWHRRLAGVDASERPACQQMTGTPAQGRSTKLIAIVSRICSRATTA